MRRTFLIVFLLASPCWATWTEEPLRTATLVSFDAKCLSFREDGAKQLRSFKKADFKDLALRPGVTQVHYLSSQVAARTCSDK